MPGKGANLPIMAQGKSLQAGQIAQKWDSLGYFWFAAVLAARSLRNRLGTFDARSSFAIRVRSCWGLAPQARRTARAKARGDLRSEEHTSELQSLRHLVCRLLLEKKKILYIDTH